MQENNRNGTMQDEGAAGSSTPEVPPPAEPVANKFRNLLRQNSEKVGIYAENVVLPKSKRSIKRVPHEVIPLDVESQQGTQVVASPHPAAQQRVYQFPFFMVLMSFTQAILFYYGSEDLWLYLGYDPQRRHEIWRYITIMLVHSSASHLWGNLAFQLILGVFLEIVHHWKRIGIIYLASVFGGSLIITVLEPNTYGVGASGGVYGLLFAHISTFILNWDEMGCKCCRLFWLLAYIAFDLGLNAYVELVLDIKTNTSHAGHFGGALTGFLVSGLVLKNFEKHPWEKKYQQICAGILIITAALIIIVNISYPSMYLKTEFNFNYEESYYKTLFKALDETPLDSEIRKACNAEPECKEAYEAYKNETMATG